MKPIMTDAEVAEFFGMSVRGRSRGECRRRRTGSCAWSTPSTP